MKIEIIIEGVDKASGVLGSVAGAAKTLGTVALGTAAVGLAALGAGLGFAISEAMEAEQVQAQLNAVLESTGGVAGMTADEINAMATKLSGMTTYTDDAIISAQSLLLTFTNIGEGVFPDATQAILDLSTAMGGDLQGATIQVGKALNDPIAGITALTRVGVSFTQEQKDVIAALVETGDVAAAQQLILAELNKEFGGSASAAAQTFAGRMTQLKNRIADLAEEIGGPLLSALSPFLDMLLRMAGDVGEKVTRFLDGIRVPLQFLGEAFRELGEGDIAGFFDRLRVAVFGIFQVFGANEETLNAIRTIFDQIKLSVEANLTPFETLMEILDNFLPEETIMAIWGFVEALTTVKNAIIEFITPIIEAVLQFVTWKDVLLALGVAIASVVVPAILSFLAAIAPVALAIAGLIGGIALIRTAWETDWMGIRTAVTAFADWFVGTGIPNINAAVNSFKAAWPNIWEQVVQPALTSIVEGILNFIAWLHGTAMPNIQAFGAAWGPLWETIRTIAGQAVDWLVDKISLGWNLIKLATEIVLRMITTIWTAFGAEIILLATVAWDTIKGVFEGALETIRLVVNAFAALIKGDWETFNENIMLAIANTFETMIDFIIGAGETVVAAFVTIATMVLEVFTGQDWGQLGRVIIEGMLNALEAGKDAVIGFITQLALDTIAGIMNALGSHSPSKEAYDAFWTIIQGGQKALEDGRRLMAEAGAMAGGAAVSGLSSGSGAFGLLNPGSAATNGAGGTAGAVNNFYMTVNTSAESSTVIRDFQLMAAMIGG